MGSNRKCKQLQKVRKIAFITLTSLKCVFFFIVGTISVLEERQFYEIAEKELFSTKKLISVYLRQKRAHAMYNILVQN